MADEAMYMVMTEDQQEGLAHWLSGTTPLPQNMERFDTLEAAVEAMNKYNHDWAEQNGSSLNTIMSNDGVVYQNGQEVRVEQQQEAAPVAPESTVAAPTPATSETAASEPAPAANSVEKFTVNAGDNFTLAQREDGSHFITHKDNCSDTAFPRQAKFESEMEAKAAMDAYNAHGKGQLPLDQIRHGENTVYDAKATHTIGNSKIGTVEVNAHGEILDKPSPMGGIDVTDMAEGATLLYSRADTPDVLRTGVLMHNQDTANGQRLDILNDQGGRERIYTGADQGHESDWNRLGAVVGYATPTDKPLFVAGVGEDGKLVDKPQDAVSHGVFFHDTEGNAVPVGQAVNVDLANQLKDHISQGKLPEPVESLKTQNTLSSLRETLDNPPAEPVQEKKAELNRENEEKPDPLKSQQDQQNQNPDHKENTDRENKQEQTQTVHQHIGFMSYLLMNTVNAGKHLHRALRGPDANEWQHRAHAHLDSAQQHIDAISHHPAMQGYQQLPKEMPEQAKALYAESILRNNPDLKAHYARASEHVEKAQDAVFMAQRKNGNIDPALTEKASKIHQAASQLPDMDANGGSGGLFSKLKSFFSGGPSENMQMSRVK